MNNIETAKIIANQLGNKCLFMLGAKNLLAGTNQLTFRIRGSKVCNYLQIVLDPSDTYTVNFKKIRGLDCKEVSSHSGIYCDGLHQLIERVTGLYTSL